MKWLKVCIAWLFEEQCPRCKLRNKKGRGAVCQTNFGRMCEVCYWQCSRNSERARDGHDMLRVYRHTKGR